MLVERGKVVEIKGEKVIVAVDKKDRGHCGSCSLCKKGTDGLFFLEAVNKGQAKEGERVVVRIDDTTLLKGVLFIYGLPLTGFIAGVVAAYFIDIFYLKVVIFLSVFTAFWYYGLKKGNETGKKNLPEVIKEKDDGYEREG